MKNDDAEYDGISNLISDSVSTQNSVKITSFISVFVVVGVLYVISIFIFTGEIIYSKMSKKF